MKTPKTYYPVLVAAVIAAGAFIPTTFGGEKDPAPEAQQSAATQSDPVLVSLNEKLVHPLRQQAKRWALMSRKGPSSETSYHIVETDTKTPAGIREFQITQVSTPFNQKQKPVSKDYLKVRHLANSDTILVALKNDWVTIDKHPLLKHLPKKKAGQKITP